MLELSPKDAARALGVSESSIRRWVDRGELPCHRTAGGHRRLKRADLIAYAREQGLSWRLGVASEPDQDPAGAAVGAQANDVSDPVEELTEALLAGDATRAEALLIRSYTLGKNLGEVFDTLVSPAMVTIGALWCGGSEGILAEHRATSIVAAAIGRLRDLGSSAPGPEPGPAAVGGAIEGDPYSLPSQMSDAVLRGLGYSAFDLGPNTPVSVIGEAASQDGVRLAWISVNHVADPVTARRSLLETLAAHASPTTRFVLGGRALDSLDLPPLEHVHLVQSMRELEEFAGL